MKITHLEHDNTHIWIVWIKLNKLKYINLETTQQKTAIKQMQAYIN
jgi:hypothetical protein